MTVPKTVGVGSPVVDLLTRVPHHFLESVPGEKGGRLLVDRPTMDALLSRLTTPCTRALGGAAGNTVFTLTALGAPTAMLGKLGNDDEGRYYAGSFERLGGDARSLKATGEAPTARCLSLITPDSQRTMRTCLGAADLFSRNDVTCDDFAGNQMVYLEGYLLWDSAIGEHILAMADRLGLTVALDLGTFEVVRNLGARLNDLLKRHVDIVFANEDEAAAFCGWPDPVAGLEALAACCPTAVVKLGARGALVQEGAQRCHIPALPVTEVVDTTGAGDVWAAGFLYGRLHHLPMERCGLMGASLAAEAVAHLGATPPLETIADIKRQW